MGKGTEPEWAAFPYVKRDKRVNPNRKENRFFVNNRPSDRLSFITQICCPAENDLRKNCIPYMYSLYKLNSYIHPDLSIKSIQ